MNIILIGFTLFMVGCTHRFLPVSKLDSRLVKLLQPVVPSRTGICFFQEMWFLGRTPFALIFLVLLVAVDWKLGGIAGAVFGAVVSFEVLLKKLFKRQRPFKDAPEIAMHQPREPHDPSFPSGDALRIWYLALLLGLLITGTAPFWPGGILLALLVSLGRIILGVHYPTDVIAGAGLGMIGAGTTIWLWQYFSII